MERERLTRLVEEPGRVAREDLAGLKTLAEKYPWFSGAHLLRTAGERSSADVLFDETLRTSSAHLPSRAALFDITTSTAPKPVMHVVKPAATKTVEIAKPAMVVEAEVLPPVELVLPELAEVVPAPELIAAEEPPTPQAPEVDELGAELDEQILRSALAGLYDVRQLEVPVASEAKPKEVPDQPKPVVRRSPIALNARLRFSDWLEETEQESSTPAAPIAAPAGPAQQRPITPLEVLPPKELIDRFIRQENPEPKITAPFFKPQTAGKRSLEDSVGLVTETLARVYEKQGNLPKAIITYRKLALKYPEKAAYFAALQKKLEDQPFK